MQRFDNPFHDLWLTEILEPAEFVEIFSPNVVRNAEALFSTGNVVVRGTQGSGKSMLLNLLTTKTRIAYAKSKTDYPFSKDTPFISAGTHLIRDNAQLITQRIPEIADSEKAGWATATFSDYLNYVIALDLIRNVMLMAEYSNSCPPDRRLIDMSLNAETEAAFVQRVASADCWFDYLKGCRTISELGSKLSARLQSYRRYFNYAEKKLDGQTEATKTLIGDPLVAIAESLRESQVVPKETLIFLRLDQHEELHAIERSAKVKVNFRGVINRVLAQRDPRVSYRVGTRHYSWDEHLAIWGSGAKLEHLRDFIYVDLDEIYRRKESTGPSPFDDFAQDVFRRRLRAAKFALPKQLENAPLAAVFGTSDTPFQRAKRLVALDKPLLKFPADWDAEWKKELTNLWKSGHPLTARLGESWLRQRAQQEHGVHLDRNSVPGTPWMYRKYWLKERYETALVQMAGDAQQALIWSGDRHILALSGANILAFMSICRAIWATWLRKMSEEELSKTELPSISVQQQVIGINEASRIWYDKIKEGPDGDRRKVFINAVGTWMSDGLRGDRALSNPGNYGFSVAQEEMGGDDEMCSLLKSCRDNGDLIEALHTTKLNDHRPRLKWYLAPLLCPHFKIPFARTKEPIYTNLHRLGAILNGAKGSKTRLNNASDDPQQKMF